MNQRINKSMVQRIINRLIDPSMGHWFIIFYEPNKYFHTVAATAPEANDPQEPTFEDITQCATGATETSGNLYWKLGIWATG